MVTSPTKKGVILIGGFRNGEQSPLLYELSGDSEENLTWSELDQKLSTGRSLHVSFPIPNNCIPYQFEKSSNMEKLLLKMKKMREFCIGKYHTRNPLFRN